MILGYCPWCGRDLDATFCDHCGRETDPDVADVTEEIRLAWNPRRDATVQVFEIVARVRQLPPGARVREIVVIVDVPVPQLPRGQHGG